MRDRPRRLIANACGRPEAVVGKTEAAAAFAERRDLERILRAANAGAGNRVDPDQIGILLDGAGLQAGDFGLGPPRFAFRGLKKSTPQPANETRTKEPTRYKRTPRTIPARSTNLFKDSSTP